MADRATMNSLIEAEPIPLKCILCPKKPGFSDVSHLLTHIASKTHLAFRFRVEVQSDSDPAARETLGQYEEWYERYGIRALLAGRMAAKDQKKPLGKRARLSGAGGTEVGRSSSITKRKDDFVKIEPDECTGAEPLSNHWQTAPSNLNTSLHLHSARHDYAFDQLAYSTPTLKRTREYSILASPEHLVPLQYHRWPSTSETITTESALPSENTTEYGDEENDSSKLKGVKWPGMGLFDSANEDQKRKRNQRKDHSVLKLMEQTSSSVEPTEFVWTGGGEFQRTRDIYDSPSIEGSPDRKFEEEEKTTKKRARRTDAAAGATKSRQTRQARPTRSSARIARIKQTAKSKDEASDAVPDQEGTETNPLSARAHGTVDAYDVFRDPLDRTTGDRTESSLDESSFEIRRPALQPLSSNMAIASPTPKPLKHTPLHYNFEPRESLQPAFPSLNAPQVHGTQSYFQVPHAIGPESLNPLCIQSRGGFTSFTPFGYQNYGHEAKTQTANFQSVNAMSNAMGNLSYSTYTHPYSDHTTNRAHDFDI